MRYKLMTVIDETSNNIIYDPTSIDWTKFLWTQGYYKHYVSEYDVLKPYGISYAYYNDVQYEDIILLLNGVENPWDMYPGAMLKVPKQAELDRFILNNMK